MKLPMLLLLSLLCTAALPVWADGHEGAPAAPGAEHDSHRLRELRLRQALKNGDISADEAERWRRRLHRADKYRLPPAAGGDKFWSDDEPRHYWRDKRRKSHSRD